MTENDPSRDARNKSESPWYVKILISQGLAVFLILFLVGAIPGTTSPLVEFFRQHEALANTIKAHDEDSGKILRELLKTNRVMCRGVWKGNPEMQETCGPIQ